MTWLSWVWIGVIAGGLIFIAYSLYTLYSAGKNLKAQLDSADQKVNQALANIEGSITPAEPHTDKDLVNLVQARRALLKSKEERRQKRQRRLVARLRDIEIDKRFL